MNYGRSEVDHLQAYIERVNWTKRIFGGKEYAVGNLTSTDRAELLESIETELSPENLCCDGLLSGPALLKKTAMLNGAKASLLKLQAGETYK